jgi:[protein-PII] uridylyltransferase
VLFLIEQHLILSALMSSRDLSDPAVVTEGAHRIGTLERLKLLTLLTYADIAAVNPETMTPWRAEQLWRAYRTIRAELTRELRTERITASNDDPWLQGFPTRYLRIHTAGDVARHRKLAEEARIAGTALDLRKTDAAWEATFVAADRPGLFAAVCGALASLGMSILKVEAFANSEGQVLDIFTFGDPLRTLELNPSEIDTVRRRVLAAIKGQGEIEKWLKARPKPKIRVATEPLVVVDNESTDSATLIEIVTDDRPGLLYDIASTLSGLGCSIDVVLIDTEAQKALDTLYITKSGVRLSDDGAALVRERLLDVCRG